MKHGADSLPPLSAAQTEIMGAIWEHGEATLNDVCTHLAKTRALARNTVQTQLTRLVDKGWLSYRADGKSFVYSATVAREAAQSDGLHRLVNALFGGSTEGLMMTLLGGNRLSKDEADRIRLLIDKAEEERK